MSRNSSLAALALALGVATTGSGQTAIGYGALAGESAVTLGGVGKKAGRLAAPRLPTLRTDGPRRPRLAVPAAVPTLPADQKSGKQQPEMFVHWARWGTAEEFDIEPAASLVADSVERPAPIPAAESERRARLVGRPIGEAIEEFGAPRIVMRNLGGPAFDAKYVFGAGDARALVALTLGGRIVEWAESAK